MALRLTFLFASIFIILSCSSTKEIAQSNTAINASSHRIASVSGSIKTLAASSTKRLSLISNSAEKGELNQKMAFEQATLGIIEQETIILKAAELNTENAIIDKEASDISEALTGVKDITPWWADMLMKLAVAGSVIGVCFLLWYTGIGSFIKGVIGYVTPAKRKEAAIAAAAFDVNDPTTLREFIASKRAGDPEFDRAWKDAISERSKYFAQPTKPSDVAPVNP